MNVTQLKQKLAVLEAQGYGELDVVMMYWDHLGFEFVEINLEEVEEHEGDGKVKLY